jgi:hypothetical protein
MKTQSSNFRISPYGRAAALLETLVEQGLLERRSVAPPASGPQVAGGKEFLKLWVACSPEVDEKFVALFRRCSTLQTRLLLLNDESERPSADSLFTHLMGLQIRSPQRFYVADSFGAGKIRFMALLLQRLASAHAAKDNFTRILDAKIEAKVLRVISTDFNRLDVPITQIPAFANADHKSLAGFEIDEDGSFIYWPKLDVHLGWEQLFQIVNPDAARKALQKNQQFNVRYGKAVRKVREQAGLEPAAIAKLSEKQVARIEKGECRLTSNAIDALSKAHGLEANEYLQKLAEALST